MCKFMAHAMVWRLPEKKSTSRVIICIRVWERAKEEKNWNSFFFIRLKSCCWCVERNNIVHFMSLSLSLCVCLLFPRMLVFNEKWTKRLDKQRHIENQENKYASPFSWLFTDADFCMSPLFIFPFHRFDRSGSASMFRDDGMSEQKRGTRFWSIRILCWRKTETKKIHYQNE